MNSAPALMELKPRLQMSLLTSLDGVVMEWWWLGDDDGDDNGDGGGDEGE